MSSFWTLHRLVRRLGRTMSVIFPEPAAESVLPAQRVTMSEQASGAYRLQNDRRSGVIDVCSASSCWERWVIQRIPGVQQDASLLQLFIWGQSPQIAQHPVGCVMLYPASEWASFSELWCVALDSTNNYLLFIFYWKKSDANTLWFTSFKEFMFCRLHHLLRGRQRNKYRFELESSESVSLIHAGAAAGRASLFFLPQPPQGGILLL